jgi:hypothetical protein
MKKALAGPPKRTATAKKLPERRAMIAAAQRRIGAVLSAAAKGTRRLDRAAARRIEQLRPPLARQLHWARTGHARLAKAIGNRLRPVGVLVLRVFAKGERWLRRASSAAIRGATRASGVVTPRRAACAVIVASSICLIVSQFVTFRSVEIGQPGYADLTAAAPPTVGAKTAGEVSSYLLVPIALLAAIAGALALRPARRGLGRVVVALGLLGIALILIVDLPAGLDAGAQSSRFSGATAVLEAGFYAQLAAAAGLVIGGLLYYARPCRIRINLSGRAASARRRRRRPPDSSRDRAARRPSRRRNGAASAPASQP